MALRNIYLTLTPGVGDGQGGLACCDSWSCRVRHDSATELNWTEHGIWASQGALVVKNPLTDSGDVRDTGSVPGLGRSPGGGHGNPLQCSCLENPRDSGACWAVVYGVVQSWTWLNRLSSKEYLPYITWYLGFPGGASGKEPTCQFRRCKRHGFSPWVGKIPWRKAWQPAAVFLPGDFHGQRNLACYSSYSSQRVGHGWKDLVGMDTWIHALFIYLFTSQSWIILCYYLFHNKISVRLGPNIITKTGGRDSCTGSIGSWEGDMTPLSFRNVQIIYPSPPVT